MHERLYMNILNLQVSCPRSKQSWTDKQRFFSTSSSLFKPVFCSTADEAVSDIPSGSKLLVGGEKIDKHRFIMFGAKNRYEFHFAQIIDNCMEIIELWMLD